MPSRVWSQLSLEQALFVEARTGSTLVGLLVADARHSPVLIHKVFVDPRHREQGIVRKLANALFDHVLTTTPQARKRHIPCNLLRAS